MKGDSKAKTERRAMSPGEAIRAYCVHCCGGLASEVEGCDGDESARDKGFMSCEFHSYRLGKGRPSVKIIRQFCLSCQGGRADFVRDCIKPSCGLYPFRMGKNPNRAGIGGNIREQLSQDTPEIRPVSGGFDGYNQRSPVEMREGSDQGGSCPETPVYATDKKMVPAFVQGDLFGHNPGTV